MVVPDFFNGMRIEHNAGVDEKKRLIQSNPFPGPGSPQKASCPAGRLSRKHHMRCAWSQRRCSSVTACCRPAETVMGVS